MTSRFRLGVLAACGVLAAAGQTMTALSGPASPDKPACEVLREWARAYEGTQPTLAEFASFDRGHQIAIFNAVTPEVRAALWQEQIERFSQRTDLSPVQRALLTEARAILTPAFYRRDRRDQAARLAFEQFRPRAEAAFTSPEHREVWFDLGSVILTAERAAIVTTDPLPENAYGLGLECNCAVSQPTAHCGSGVCNQGGCMLVFLGCGFAHDRDCNGLCGSR